MKNMAFVYNPVSGKEIIKNNLGNIMDILSDEEAITVMPSGRRMMEFVSEFKGDRIICAGGDGTIHNLIEAALRLGYKGEIGYIPVGTTNDFANSLGIPTELTAAAEIAIGEHVTVCDAGKFNDDYFDYVAAFGMFTKLSYSTPQAIKNNLGYFAYMAEAAKELQDIISYDMTIELDGEPINGRYVFGMVTNSRYVGGFKIHRNDIGLDDGIFELTLVKEHPKMSFPNITNYLLGLTSSSKYVETYQAKKIVFRSDEEIAWTLDGENGGSHTLVKVSNINKAFRIAT